MSKEKAPKVSVVLPVYNAKAYVGEVLATIIEQGFSDFEVIVIDDGSRDDSAEVVKRYAKMDGRIKYHYQENRGGDKLGTTLNHAISLAKGELIARADSDDPWMLDHLEKQVNYMDKHPNCVICGGGAEIMDGEGRHTWTLINTSEDEDIRRTMTLYTPLNHGGVMFRKKAFDEVGGYQDVKYAEDFDLWVRMSRLGKLYNFPEAVFRYRKNDVGISLSNEQAQKEAIEKIATTYWEENKPKFLGVGDIRKKMKGNSMKKNGGALSWVFLEDTLSIATNYRSRDGNFVKSAAQMLAVALSSKTGFRLFLKRMADNHAQKIKFGMVGVANTLIDVALFAVFANAIGLTAEIASVMSTSVAIVFSFFANYYYVWRSKKSKARTVPQFLAVTLITAWGVQTAVIWAVKSIVGDGDWENLLAKVCAIVIGMVINYLLYKVIFTGKERDDKK